MRTQPTGRKEKKDKRLFQQALISIEYLSSVLVLCRLTCMESLHFAGAGGITSSLKPSFWPLKRPFCGNTPLLLRLAHLLHFKKPIVVALCKFSAERLKAEYYVSRSLPGC